MLEKAFDEYTHDFDLTDSKLLSKYNHSYRVMNLCMKYAKELNWSKEDVELAKIIGLLHDIGRFKQYEKYHSFIDKDTIDHADYGVELLFDDKEIERFTDRKEDYDIIKFAIQNHNKFSIPKTDERKLKFTKLIRDADKIDILYVVGASKEFNTKDSGEIINDKVMECFNNHQLVPVVITKNYNEHLAIKFAYVFDINYDITLLDFKKNLDGFYKILENNHQFKEIYNMVSKYIDERINNINKGEIKC